MTTVEAMAAVVLEVAVVEGGGFVSHGIRKAAAPTSLDVHSLVPLMQALLSIDVSPAQGFRCICFQPLFGIVLSVTTAHMETERKMPNKGWTKIHPMT